MLWRFKFSVGMSLLIVVVTLVSSAIGQHTWDGNDFDIYDASNY